MGGEWRSVLRISLIGLACLAFCIMVLFTGYFIGQSAGFYDAQANGYAGQYREATRQRIDECFRKGGPSPATTRCVEEAVTTGHEDQRSEGDLNAQRDMANWAWWLLIATFAQIPFTAVGIILLLRNIQQADAALIEARRIGEAQTRAYLSVSACTVVFAKDKISILPKLQNSGQSPALRVKWQAKIYLMRQDTKALREGETDPEHRGFVYNIPTQGERKVISCGCGDFLLSQSELEAFQNDVEVTLLVRVWANGADVFKMRVSTFETFINIMKGVPEDGDEISLNLGTHSEKSGDDIEGEHESMLL